MTFKKSLAALAFALPVVLGVNLSFSENDDVDVLTMVVASPAKGSDPACDFLEPIKQDLIENLFTNECGDAVSHLSSYEHLPKDRLYRLTVLYDWHSMMP